MKKVPESDQLKDFEKAGQITDIVREGIANKQLDTESLVGLIADCSDTGEFLQRITSEEEFERIDAELQKAFDKRNPQRLVARIEARRVQKRRRTLWLTTGVSFSVAAAILVMALLAPWNESPGAGLVSTEDVKSVAAYSSGITAPTLIIADSGVVTLAEDGDRRILAAQYSGSDSAAATTATTQRLILPAQSTYTVLLSDGSEVMLNAGSELTYPSSFGEGAREVTLRGEAFFTVAKSDKPFIVTTGSSYVKVYGTMFNVNAATKGVVKTILVDGSVSVGFTGGEEIMVVPEQMAVLDNSTRSTMVTNIDSNSMLGWRDGYFRCIDCPFTDLIEELSVWYGVDFTYLSSDFTDRNINISVRRSNPIERVLTLIENTVNVKFKTEGGRYRIERT